MLPNDISGYKLYENSWPSLCPWGFTNLKYHWIVKLGAWKETNGQITREEYSPFHVHSHFSTREPFWILYLGYTYFWFNPTRPILVPFGLKTLLIFYKISDEHDNSTRGTRMNPPRILNELKIKIVVCKTWWEIYQKYIFLQSKVIPKWSRCKRFLSFFFFFSSGCAAMAASVSPSDIRTILRNFYLHCTLQIWPNNHGSGSFRN